MYSNDQNYVLETTKTQRNFVPVALLFYIMTTGTHWTAHFPPLRCIMQINNVQSYCKWIKRTAMVRAKLINNK